MSEEKKDMPGWAVRANEEFRQLRDRRHDLSDFLMNLPDDVAEDQKLMMRLQLQAMTLYAHFLGSRLMMAGCLKED